MRTGQDASMKRGLINPLLTLMPFGNSRATVPEGRTKIAQRFNAGPANVRRQAPKGRKKRWENQRALSSLAGLVPISGYNPALKRWAIVGRPAGLPLHVAASNFRP